MTSRNFLVGLFVAAGLTLFTVGLFLIGNRHETFAHHIDYYAEFVNLSGLTKGDKVQVAGMDAGQIEEVGIPTSPTGRFRIKIRINDVLHGLVRTDSVVTVATEGVVGNTFLLIHPGSASAPAAPAYATLNSKEPTELADLLDQGKEVLTDVDGTVKNANGVLTSVGGNLDSTLIGVKATVADVNDVVIDLKHGRGSAGMLLHDEVVADQIRQMVTNAKETAANLNRASGQANTLLADVQSRQIPQKIDSTIVSAGTAASNLDAASKKLLQTVSDATGPDERGVTAGANLRETLSNTNAATANAADETEALKHNFLFRGFFRHNGYSKLGQLSSEDYRRDKFFTNPANSRTWLSSSQLFESGIKGTEQLTAEGKSLLDRTVAQYGDALFQDPIVVEGYEGGSDSEGQLVRSRSRALLVRRYLQEHDQIVTSHIGIVAMRNLPPDGLSHPTWDGICLVVLRRKQ